MVLFHRCPNLNVEGILGGSYKGLDFKVLLQGLEEQLNLPPIFVDSRYGIGAELEMICEEDNLSFIFSIPNNDSAEWMGAILRA